MNRIHIRAGDLRFTFLNTGDLFEAGCGNIRINQLLGNVLDGSLNNLYLRIYRQDQRIVVPLLGVKSKSTVKYSKSNLEWKGRVLDLDYSVTFTLTDQGIWFWDVIVEGAGAEVEVIYGQDISIANRGAVQSNEAYVSQYIDHAVFYDEELGYVVCSRQNQPQETGFPYLQQGCLTKAVGYSTDGFQFFGLDYKDSFEPQALKEDCLANEVYQYEFAYTALQSERVLLQDEARFVFYGMFRPNHPQAVAELEYDSEVEQAWETVQDQEITFQDIPQNHVPFWETKPLRTIPFSKKELELYFPHRQHEEWADGKLLSFFTPDHAHIVLKDKELLVERPHGHILMSGENHVLRENPITTTCYMYGVFNSQLVVGNTSFNKMLTNTRNALNVMKISGQRIYVKLEDGYYLLAVPSLFEMGFNYVRWYYKTSTETFIITNYTTVGSPEVYLEVSAVSGKKYGYLVTNQVSMNDNEYERSFHMEQDGNTLLFRAHKDALNAQVYPELLYRMEIRDTPFRVQREDEGASLVVLELSPTHEWSLVIQGLLHGEDVPFTRRDLDVEIKRYREFFRDVMNGFQLSLGDETPSELTKLNTLAWWYTHNMLVHFSVPHGLEQYGGAAWGTRDVCQGPAEYFSAMQNYETVREIIKKVYSHQFMEDGSWPQWFMFDRYYRIQAGESHGDIIVWPLKVVGDYLAVSGDYSILDEQVPYTRWDTKEFTSETETILDHIYKQIQYIQDNFLHDTYLSSYGDGDWDDTLQPANEQLKQYMASSWTVALTYQAVNRLADVLREVDGETAQNLKNLAEGIGNDFRRYMLSNDVIPGFVYLENPAQPEFMVHPQDQRTGIQYRLLPMTRSIISELMTLEEAEAHYEIIQKQLACPDGVRLMNRPANYSGGVSVHFKRAEQAANFGREIGLQYVHAHIRYIEAMAKLGKAEDAWHGLNVINPITIQDVVPNAERRQSNTYFSSSDGKFNTRYEAAEGFHKLRTGEVGVKGGWRIYSSGPGIYMNQLISNCLGVRFYKGALVLDPVLPERFHGLAFDFQLKNCPVQFLYYLNSPDKGVRINGEWVCGKRLSNPYRDGGFVIPKEVLEAVMKADGNLVEVYL